MYVCPIAAQKKKAKKEETFQSFEIVPSQTTPIFWNGQSIPQPICTDNILI